MIRRLCTLLAIVMVISAAFVAPHAEAQGQPTCVRAVVADPDPAVPTPTVTADDTMVGSDTLVAATDCADAQAYPGPFTNMPTVPASPYSAPVGITAAPELLVIAPDNEPTVTTVTGRDLAHSGTETFVLAYLGTGLLAFGAFAMGIRRGSPNGRR